MQTVLEEKTDQAAIVSRQGGGVKGVEQRHLFGDNRNPPTVVRALTSPGSQTYMVGPGTSHTNMLLTVPGVLVLCPKREVCNRNATQLMLY